MSEEIRKFETIGHKIGRLVDQKNRVYGDSFAKSGRILRELYPNGVPVEQYDSMLAVVRIIDKLFRIATDGEAFNEDPFQDIAGYGILGCQLKKSNGFKKGVK